MVPRAGIEPAT